MSGEWHDFSPGIHMVQEGHVGGNLNTASRACGGNHSKVRHTPVVNLYNDM
jgi:hypothetical protein